MDIIKRMPKAELHIHLDGSVRPRTVEEIAQEEGIALPDADPSALPRLLQVQPDCRNLPDYLSKFDLPLRCMQSEKALRRIAFEIVEDAALQGVKYMEVRFAPRLHTAKGLSLEAAIAAVLAGLEKGERSTGTVVRAIVICMRSHEPDANLRVMLAAQAFLGKGVVGLDLAGDEVRFPPGIHRRVFRLAHETGFPITIHAGEAAGPENIRESVVDLCARRIGHGVRLKEDPALLEWMIERRIALEMCVTSNVQTKAASDWESHPVKEYFRQGLVVTLNTDNTTVSGTDLTNEIQHAVDRLAFSLEDIARMTIHAVKASFLEESKKQPLLDRFRSDFRRLGVMV